MKRKEIIWMVIALVAIVGFLVTAYGAGVMFETDHEQCQNYMSTNCICRTGNDIVPYYESQAVVGGYNGIKDFS